MLTCVYVRFFLETFHNKCTHTRGVSVGKTARKPRLRFAKINPNSVFVIPNNHCQIFSVRDKTRPTILLLSAAVILACMYRIHQTDMCVMEAYKVLPNLPTILLRTIVLLSMGSIWHFFFLTKCLAQ